MSITIKSPKNTRKLLRTLHSSPVVKPFSHSHEHHSPLAKPIRNTRAFGFVQHLGDYLTDLEEAESPLKVRSALGGLEDTLKLQKQTESITLASKLQHSQMKMKDLKMKNYYQENELKAA